MVRAVFYKHSPDEAHVQVRSWNSELRFMKDEIHFFEDLLDRYFIALAQSGQGAGLTALVDELNVVGNNDIPWLLSMLEELDLRIGSAVAWEIKTQEKYVETGERMLSLHRQFSELKTRIFQSVGQVLHKEL